MAFFGLQTPQNYKYWYIKLFWMFRNPNTPLWPRKNLHFWKFQNFSIFLGVAKSMVLGGQRGGVWALNPFIRSSNIWGYMVLSFFGSKKVNFKENIGGAFKAPPPNRIFLTPRQIGLRVPSGKYQTKGNVAPISPNFTAILAIFLPKNGNFWRENSLLTKEYLQLFLVLDVQISKFLSINKLTRYWDWSSACFVEY